MQRTPLGPIYILISSVKQFMEETIVTIVRFTNWRNWTGVWILEVTEVFDKFLRDGEMQGVRGLIYFEIKVGVDHFVQNVCTDFIWRGSHGDSAYLVKYLSFSNL